MHRGKLASSQRMVQFPLAAFARRVSIHRGEHIVEDFFCLDWFFAVTFAQQTYRESLRDFGLNLRAQAMRLYHMGFRWQTNFCTTLANANTAWPWRTYADLAQHLICQARPLYAEEFLIIELDAAVCAFDAVVIDQCLSLYPWPLFRTIKQPFGYNPDGHVKFPQPWPVKFLLAELPNL